MCSFINFNDPGKAYDQKLTHSPFKADSYFVLPRSLKVKSHLIATRGDGSKNHQIDVQVGSFTSSNL